MINEHKILTIDRLVEIREKHRTAGQAVVWTNGCFDLIHEGHILSLESAKKLGDILVVGVNSDDSVRQLKGEGRPLCNQDARAAVVAALGFVDYVLIFNDKRCTVELERLKPEVYAQGSDYTLETIDQDERRAVENGGGKVAFLPFVDGISTSLILKKIRRSDPERIVSAAFGIIRNEKGEMLMVATRYVEGIRWGLPGGGHERGENLEEAVLREVKEEVGLEATVDRYVGVIERIEPAMNLHLVLHLFELKVTGGEVMPNLEEDIESACWFDAHRLSTHDGWVLGREHFIKYLEAPENFPRYVFMGPGEE